MNRLDLIIDALQNCSAFQPKNYYDIDKALAAARELKALKPVAWMLPKYGDVLSAAECQGVSGIYNTPLYALNEVKHD